MKYSPYEFKKEDAYEFARIVGIETYERGGELHFKKCPYCNNSTKDEKTFAISLRTGQFKCLRDSCMVSGNMIKLSQDFDFSLGNEVDEYYNPRRKFVTLVTPVKPIEPKPKAIEYLKSRGISERVARLYEITVQDDNENVLVFLFYDERGKLVYKKYRNTQYQGKGNKEWSEKGGKPVLFGMKQCNSRATLVITEGQLDSLSVAEAGVENAVSVPNGVNAMTWIPYCWDFVNSFTTIIVFGDHEKGHITLLDAIKNRFKIQIKHVREEDYKDCKDANEILCKYGIKQIRECIRNAVILPLNNVIELSDVKEINPFEIKKLPTGFNELDKVLYGGLPFGGISIITGKAGEGKSTVASQIIINAIETGHKCFCYSGELPSHLFKSWMNFQVAGAEHIFKYQTRWGDEGYNISSENREKISEWYKGKIKIYDSNSLDENNENIIETIEKVITRYMVDVILLDNLMTALDLDVRTENDKFEQQSRFLKKLAKITLKYNVLILLVAHKRKNNFSKNANDEVSGSSDISNLASVVVSYGKDEDVEDDQRILSISKNRLFGKTGSWTMNYDEKSKRVYGDADDKDKEFSWGGGFEEVEENPFM